MKKKFLIRFGFSLLLVSFLLAGKSSAQTSASCSAPGNVVVTDVTGDAVLAQNDIQTVSISEPFNSDGTQTLVFTMKVQNLYSLPLSSWNVIFKGPDNVTRFVQMSNLLGFTEFKYGTMTNLLGIPIFNVSGNIPGKFDNNGTVTFFVNKGLVGNLSAGQTVEVSAKSYIKVLLELVEVDSTTTSVYSVAGNAGCTPYKIKQWGMNGDIPVAGNYFRNEVEDFAVWRPETGTWYVTDALTNATKSFQLGNGATGDIPTPGNFDRDGKTDFAVYRPSNGTWYIQKSETNTFASVRFGAAEDIPMTGDFDGDRVDDAAVFRPSAGAWYVLNSLDSSVRGVGFGAHEDRPVIGDYDGDRKADFAVFRPSSGYWYILQSSNGAFRGLQFGVDSDTVVPADYDGDGKTDVAVWRPENGAWYVYRSSDSVVSGFTWGASPDRVQPGDYNGNGRADYAVWRPETGIWYAYLN